TNCGTQQERRRKHGRYTAKGNLAERNGRHEEGERITGRATAYWRGMDVDRIERSHPIAASSGGS
ncbi:MAG: hypothetical protein RLZZ621_952, partial [Gemmatimonadota bacterium]